MNASATITFVPIGTIATPHVSLDNMPIQPVGAKGVCGTIELNAEYTPGLSDIEGFSHIILLYHLHQVTDFKLSVTPFMDDKEHGIFATRSPKRPNPIGISIVSLTKVVGNTVYFEGADMLNGTPLIDIKPFFRQTDNRIDARSGWLDEKNDDLASEIRSDSRFK